MLAVMLLLCVASAGCWGGAAAGPPKSITTGKVNYQGVPVEQGMIMFIPVSGPPVQTEIKSGEYRIDYKGGVALGSARVEIRGYRETGKQIPIGPGLTKPEVEQFLPTSYNENTTLTAEVEKASLVTLDFLLE